MPFPAQDIIQSSAKGELQVAQLESAARQMSAYAQSNRLKQLASLIVARTSPAEVGDVANTPAIVDTSTMSPPVGMELAQPDATPTGPGAVRRRSKTSGNCLAHWTRPRPAASQLPSCRCACCYCYRCRHGGMLNMSMNAVKQHGRAAHTHQKAGSRCSCACSAALVDTGGLAGEVQPGRA